MNASLQSDAKPVASICMPVYNAEDYLAIAIDSVLAQSYADFELIISDNGSTDRTEELCRAYCDADRRVRYFRHETNRGPNWNFEFVSQHATGEVMTWFAHDDVLEPNYLDVAATYMLQNPATSLVSCDFQIIDETGSKMQVERIEMLRDSIAWRDRQVEFFKNPNRNIYYSIYGMMRTATCQQIMRTISEHSVATGSEFPILAWFAVSGEVVSIPEVLRQYRRHAESVYTREAEAAAKAPKFKRLFSRLSNIYRLRMQQYGVLLRSSLSTGTKCRILFAASLAHKRLFFGALLRAVFGSRQER